MPAPRPLPSDPPPLGNKEERIAYLGIYLVRELLDRSYVIDSGCIELREDDRYSSMVARNFFKVWFQTTYVSPRTLVLYIATGMWRPGRNSICKNKRCCKLSHIHLSGKRPSYKVSRLQETIASRFHSSYTKGPKCWEWSGKRNAYGYGVLEWERIGTLRKHRIASRVSYELFKGPIPSGLYVCHHCDNRCCVNPEHLFVGTAQDNASDRVNKGRKIVKFTKTLKRVNKIYINCAHCERTYMVTRKTLSEGRRSKLCSRACSNAYRVMYRKQHGTIAEVRNQFYIDASKRKLLIRHKREQKTAPAEETGAVCLKRRS